jgi:hypothetical protein
LKVALLGVGVLASVAAGALVLHMAQGRPGPSPVVAKAPAAPVANPYGPMLVDLGARARLAAAEKPAEAAAPAPEAPAPASVAAEQPAYPVADVPTPPRRPTELKALASRLPPPAQTRAAQPQTVAMAPAAAPAQDKSFFEKIFGGASQPAAPQPAPGSRQAGRAPLPAQALAYAPQESGGGLFGGLQSGAAPTTTVARAGNGTAVYDISAHTVYMPDGTRLEAHSGLGSRLDDPRYVHERMKGPTPPSVYQLSPREAPFHGVEALRLTPIGSDVFGRVGLLAHTYMLGPKGDSNGCVSFRDYGAFLQAYKRGEVRRLVVVAHM